MLWYMKWATVLDGIQTNGSADCGQFSFVWLTVFDKAFDEKTY